MHEQAVTEAPKHSYDAHGPGQTHAALVVEMADIQPQVQAVFDPPRGAIVGQPLGRAQLVGRQTADQGDGLGLVMAQVAPQQSDLLDKGKIDFFRAGRSRTEHAHFQSAFVDLTSARQMSGGLLRGKNALEALGLIFQCSDARWADYP